MQSRHWMSLSAATALGVGVLVAPAIGNAQQAQQGQQGQQTQQGQQKQQTQQKQQAQQGQQAQQTIEQKGTIRDLKDIQLREQNRVNRVVLLETEQGMPLIVDLGPVQPLQGLNLEAGQEISVRGEPYRVGQGVVLFASTVEAGGEQVSVQRDEGKGGAADTAARGQITKTKEVQVRGSDRTHTVVLLETDAGVPMIVDLGPTAGLDQANLQTGQEIVVQGREGRLGNRMVLFASTLDADGKQVQIERGQGKAAGQQAAQQKKDYVSAYRQVRGEVVSTRDVKLRGQDLTARVIQIKTEEGLQVVADLGVGQQVDQIKEGDTVAIRGRDVRVGNRLVLLADMVQAGDQSYVIDRPARTRSQQQAQQQTGQKSQ